jgi:hypothetical protein
MRNGIAMLIRDSKNNINQNYQQHELQKLYYTATSQHSNILFPKPGSDYDLRKDS